MSMAAASLLIASSRVTCGPFSMAQETSFSMVCSALRAWVVLIEPGPDSMALSMFQTSGPRTSPTIWRARLNRKEWWMASSRLNSPAWRPSMPTSPDPGRCSQAWTILCRSTSSCRCSSNSVSKVPIISQGGMHEHRARTQVVLPEPWTPETTMLLPARTQAARKSARTAPHALRS